MNFLNINIYLLTPGCYYTNNYAVIYFNEQDKPIYRSIYYYSYICNCWIPIVVNFVNSRNERSMLLITNCIYRIIGHELFTRYHWDHYFYSINESQCPQILLKLLNVHGALFQQSNCSSYSHEDGKVILSLVHIFSLSTENIMWHEY